MLVIDGVTITTTPVTMLMLNCGDMIPAHPRHEVQVGDLVDCPDGCGQSPVADLVRTSLVG